MNAKLKTDNNKIIIAQLKRRRDRLLKLSWLTLAQVRELGEIEMKIKKTEVK